MRYATAATGVTSRLPAILQGALCAQALLPAGIARIGGFFLDHETHPSKALRAILVARGLRAFGDGYVSLLLPVYLLVARLHGLRRRRHRDGTLLGSGALTLAVGVDGASLPDYARCCSPRRR